ncbi:MAG: AAA family ATPase [Candidatus Hodarchaeales archaeon]
MLTLKDFTYDFDQKGFFQFFGKPGHGKTTVLIELASQAVMLGKKVLFIDCSSQLSIKRFKIYLSPSSLKSVVFFQPKTLNQLLLTVDNIELLGIYKDSCLCIDDMFTFFSSSDKKKKTEESLKKHAYIISLLANLSDRIPILITNNSIKKSGSQYKPFNEYLLSKWVQCSFLVRKKDKEILLDSAG